MRSDEGVLIVHYKCKNVEPGAKAEDLVVYIDDQEEYQKYRDGDSSIPVARFASTDIYTTHKKGTRGAQDRASDAILENEFGKDMSRDEIIQKIVSEDNDVQVTHLGERQGHTNESNSGSRTN